MGWWEAALMLRGTQVASPEVVAKAKVVTPGVDMEWPPDLADRGVSEWFGLEATLKITSFQLLHSFHYPRWLQALFNLVLNTSSNPILDFNPSSPASMGTLTHPGFQPGNASWIPASPSPSPGP
ncbi:hypothetical protein TURU_096232 [Turdus rufiventris]|nr:hypothetical protein TURU_096232 [Turdus rufiventris]